jgi:hypothetical protein
MVIGRGQRAERHGREGHCDKGLDAKVFDSHVDPSELLKGDATQSKNGRATKAVDSARKFRSPGLIANRHSGGDEDRDAR